MIQQVLGAGPNGQTFLHIPFWDDVSCTEHILSTIPLSLVVDLLSVRDDAGDSVIQRAFRECSELKDMKPIQQIIKFILEKCKEQGAC